MADSTLQVAVQQGTENTFFYSPFSTVFHAVPFSIPNPQLNSPHRTHCASVKMNNDNKSLAHTRWNCKYHVVFAPKYRRKVFFGEKREAIGRILRQLCEWKGEEIHAAEICPDHVHMLISIPPKMAVSTFMGWLKGKSSVMIYEQFGNLKYKYKGREFWCRGYYVDTVGKNKQKIAEYIQNQLREDRLGEQMTMFGKDDDPFKRDK